MIIAKLLNLKYNVALGVFLFQSKVTLICYYYLYEVDMFI